MNATREQARYISPTETAKLIRAALKAAFPAVKFSVRTDKYSGGSSIRIQYTDGPTVARVEAVAGNFEGRGFDGMIDLAFSIDCWMQPDGTVTPARSSGTEGSRGSVPAFDNARPSSDAELVHFSNSYVFVERVISPRFAQRLVKAIALFWGGVSYAPPVLLEAGDLSGGFRLADMADYRRHVRADVALEWGEAIHRAAGDRTTVTRTLALVG